MVRRAMLPVPQRATFSRLQVISAPNIVLAISALTFMAVPLKAQHAATELTSSAALPRVVGQIVGSVVNAGSGEPVTQAQITVIGTEVTAVTDLDGRYLLRNVPAGTVEITIRGIGFTPKRVTGVAVTPEETTTLNVSLDRVVVSLDAITVTAAAAESRSAEAMLDVRRNSEAVLEAIGSLQIKQIPASDAADVAQRMTGVTVNGRTWKLFDKRSIRLPYAQTPDEAVIQVALGGAGLGRFAPRRESKQLPPAPKLGKSAWSPLRYVMVALVGSSLPAWRMHLRACSWSPWIDAVYQSRTCCPSCASPSRFRATSVMIESALAHSPRFPYATALGSRGGPSTTFAIEYSGAFAICSPSGGCRGDGSTTR